MEEEKEEKKETIKIGLWTFVVLIISLIILASGALCGWYYVYVVKEANNKNEDNSNQITNKVENRITKDAEIINPNSNKYIYNEFTGYYQRNGMEYTYNEYTGEMQLVNTNNDEEDWGNYVYYDPNSVTVVTAKVSPEYSASTILKILYEDAYYIYTSQAGFMYKGDSILNYDEVLKTYLNDKARAQYERWTKDNGRWQSSEIINIKFKDIKEENNKIEATVVGDLIRYEEVLKKGLESKFSIEYNGKNWVVNEYEIPDTFIRDYIQYSEQYRITKLNEITDKFSVKDLLPDFLQTQDYQQDRYIKIDNEINTYENNSIRIIDLYHKNNYNNLVEGDMKITVAEDMKSALYNNGNGQSLKIENINGTIKKIFIGIMHDIYTPVMLMENGRIKIVSYEYGKFYARTLEGLEDIVDFRNATISSFVKNSEGEYTTADPITAGNMITCLIAIKADGTAYKITYY